VRVPCRYVRRRQRAARAASAPPLRRARLHPSPPRRAWPGPQTETRSIRVPAHRYTPLREAWQAILTPLVSHLKLQARFNATNRRVELRASQYTTEPSALQRGEDFVRAFMLGFDLADAIALLRLDDLYIGAHSACWPSYPRTAGAGANAAAA
jgi:hypothetical protein